MPSMDERLALLERRVTGLEVAHDRDIEFISKKLVEHSTRLETIEDKVDALQRDVKIVQGDLKSLTVKVDKLGTAFDAFPSIIARTISETVRAEFAARDKLHRKD